MGRLLDDSEMALFDCIASDLNELAGDEVNFYGQDIPNSTIDPLYGEPSDRAILPPVRLWAYVKWPDESPDPSEQGFASDFDGKVVISRVAFENAHSPYPYEGDIVEIWRTPYHDANSLGRGMFFDVIKVTNDGHINDTSSFVQFELTLRRRTQYGAERKIDRE